MGFWEVVSGSAMFSGSPLVDAGTLTVGEGDYRGLVATYRQRSEELTALASDLAGMREQMTEQGYSADFSDREGEMLYLLVREMKPQTVVEISPCHGYSSNYLLAGLSANGSGQLLSYEIASSVGEKPIRDVIRDNLSDRCDIDRQELVVGDAMTAEIPHADILFIDSCHEAYFAAWYLRELVSRARIVVIHDILVGRRSGVAPKAATLGVREQYYVLETLAMERVPVFSLGHFANSSAGQRLPQLKPRFMPQGLDRAIVFEPFSPGPAAAAMHGHMAQVQRGLEMALSGNRVAALEAYEQVAAETRSGFMAATAASIPIALGYKFPFNPSHFPDLKLEPSGLTVSTVVAMVELALHSKNDALFQEVVKVGRESRIDSRVFRDVINAYRTVQEGGAGWSARSIARRLRNHLRGPAA